MCSEHRNIFSLLYNHMEDNVLLSEQPRALRDRIVRVRLAQAPGSGAETSCPHRAAPAGGTACRTWAQGIAESCPHPAQHPLPRNTRSEPRPQGPCRRLATPWPIRTGRPHRWRSPPAWKPQKEGRPLYSPLHGRRTNGEEGAHGAGPPAAYWRLPPASLVGRACA